MSFLKILAAAFSMYSAVPMPQFVWDEKTSRYLLCGFPLVGAVTAGALWGWFWFCGRLGFSTAFAAAGATALPVLVSGGIHLDGFCDTVDALSSHASTERKLEILKDPHTGAFALIGCGLYLLLTFGLWTEFSGSSRACGIVGLGFLLSRAMSGLSVLHFRCAKTSGLAAWFSGAAEKTAASVVLVVMAWLCAFGMLYIDLKMGAFCCMAALSVFCYYKWMAYRQFGGITGDLAGWFLQTAELGILAAVVLTERIV